MAHRLQPIVDWMWHATHSRASAAAAPAPRASFRAARGDRLLSSWRGAHESINTLLRRDLATLRARSREQWGSNEYARRFSQLVRTQVSGPHGFQLQNRARLADGRPDQTFNDTLEDLWAEWSRRGSYDVTGRLSRPEGERLIVDTIARDGEVLVRKVRGYRTPRGYAVQILEADHLDESYNVERSDGTRIRMGVELDTWERPVAYHLLTRHPGDAVYWHGGRQYERVPAGDLIHCFLPMRPHQVRGLPWMHAALVALHALGQYREAAVIAAQVGASKLGFLTSETGDLALGAADARGDQLIDVEAGSIQQLPEGASFTAWDPSYPHEQFGAFMQSTLKGISAGLGVAYHSFANDSSQSNYSSARSAMLDERDGWAVVQQAIASTLLDDLLGDWARWQVTTGALALGARAFERAVRPQWLGRSWDWVDPLKDGQASALAVRERFQSRSEIIRRRGRDPDEVWREIAAENQLLSELGIAPESAAPVSLEPPAPDASTIDDESEAA